MSRRGAGPAPVVRGEDMFEVPASRLQELTDTIERLKKEPRLGLATTRELLTELKARGEFSAVQSDTRERVDGRMLASDANILLTHLPEGMLSYRTVDGE